MTLYKRQVKYTLYRYHDVGLGSDEVATTGWMDEDDAKLLGLWSWADSTGLHQGSIL